MNKFKINLRKETFYINESGSVIGDICFAVDEWCFPEKNWDDFVVRIIYWLSQKLIKLIFNKENVFEVPFMEGNFKIYISLNEKKECIIKFVEGDSFTDQKEVILKTIATPFEDLKTEVKKATETLLQMKESKELDFEDDYEELKKSYELLCKY